MSEAPHTTSQPAPGSTRTQEERTNTNVTSSEQLQASQTSQQSMEFAQLPSQHFGHATAPTGPFDLRHLNNALPNYSQPYNQGQQMQQFSQGSSMTSNFAYATGPSQQFANQIATQFAQQYSHNVNIPQRQYSGYGANITNNNAELQARGHFYNSQQHHYPGFQAQQPGYYGQLSVDPYQHRPGAGYSMPSVQVDGVQAAPGLMSVSPQLIRRNSSNSSLQTTSSTLRGPPRKPKQSGHALWVGNLPPGTQIMELKDHFSRNATDDIESVFLISKSNCAFVNYRTETSCAAAMNRFHDSRFRGARLVCRLRRNSNAAPSSAVESGSEQEKTPDTHRKPVEESVDTLPQAQEEGEPGPSALNTPSLDKIAKEKYFIVKSLTVEDLERSVNSGLWATQAHNEANLNLAYQTAENVYLIFSANKSGEYFGYARMEGEIRADAPSAPIESVPQPRSFPSTPADAPMTIPTPATATAPRGHIIDDSARGTIFWEAENRTLRPEDSTDAAESGETSGEDSTNKASTTQQTTFGKPFQIKWQSTEKLPFYRTRGLRNPWNANREVKIARDGTELEPSIGRRLIGMFEQQAQINAAARSSGMSSQYGYPQQLAQYPPQLLPQQPGYGYPQGSQPYGRPY